MKKFFCIFGFVFLSFGCFAVNWWEQATVCQLDPSKCYPSMGVGFEAEMWDAGSSCWGMKLVCGNSLVGGTPDDDPLLYSKTQAASGLNKKPDFDFGLLDTPNRCHGMRQTRDSGSQAMVGGGWANVFCPGVLSSPDEVLATGEIITSGPQPKCADMAADGYVIALGNKCYGKRYALPDYFIECSGNKDSPDRIIALNGARDYATGAAVAGFPVTAAAAKTLLDAMFQTSQKKRQQHFSN